jgi:hypothetical protein
MSKKMPPVHPGEILLEDFLKPLALSQTRLERFSPDNPPTFRKGIQEEAANPHNRTIVL